MVHPVAGELIGDLFEKWRYVKGVVQKLGGIASERKLVCGNDAKVYRTCIQILKTKVSKLLGKQPRYQNCKGGRFACHLQNVTGKGTRMETEPRNLPPTP